MDGTTGHSIANGGDNMYSEGNRLHIGGIYIPYSDKVLATNSLIGTGNQYFTAKYDGLFAFVAETNMPSFAVDGYLGTSGTTKENEILTETLNGITYKGYARRIYGTSAPSINHIIIVQDNGVSSRSGSSSFEDHAVSGLTGVPFVAYLLFSSRSGGTGTQISFSTMQTMMQIFLNDILKLDCSSCPSHCVTCSSPSLCFACETGYGIQNGLCETCPVGKYPFNSQCEDCISPCETCSDQTACLSCEAGYAVQNQQCKTCPQGKYAFDSQCEDCPSVCSQCTDQNTCQACASGYILDNQFCKPCVDGTYFFQGSCHDCHLSCKTCSDYQICTSCPEGTELKNHKCLEMVSPAVKGALSSTQTGTKAASQISNAISVGSPSALMSAVSGKVFSNIKYLNISYSNELQNVLENQDRNFLNFGFTLDPPSKIASDIENREIPEIFTKYDMTSNFLVNFWQNLMMILIFFTIFFFFICLTCIFTKRKSRFTFIFRGVRIAFQNFLWTQIYSISGDLVFYSNLCWRSFDPSRDYPTLIVLIMLFGITIAGIFYHISLIFKLLSIKRMKKKRLLTELKKKNEGNKLLFDEYKEGSFSQSAFLLFFTLKDMFISFVLTMLFDHPFLETIFFVLISISMIIYLLLKSPLKSRFDFAQILIYEIITFVVHAAILILAFLDMKESPSEELRTTISKIIIIMNLAFNFITLGFIVTKLLQTLKDLYLYIREKMADRKRKKRIQKLESESTFQSRQTHQQKNPQKASKRIVQRSFSNNSNETSLSTFITDQNQELRSQDLFEERIKSSNTSKKQKASQKKKDSLLQEKQFNSQQTEDSKIFTQDTNYQDVQITTLENPFSELLFERASPGSKWKQQKHLNDQRIVQENSTQHQNLDRRETHLLDFHQQCRPLKTFHKTQRREGESFMQYRRREMLKMLGRTKD